MRVVIGIAFKAGVQRLEAEQPVNGLAKVGGSFLAAHENPCKTSQIW